MIQQIKAEKLANLFYWLAKRSSTSLTLAQKEILKTRIMSRVYTATDKL